MTAITPETDEVERTAILAAMNWHKNLETFIYEILPEEQEFYVIEKDSRFLPSLKLYKLGDALA